MATQTHFNGVPSGAVKFVATSTAITSATPVSVKAAPATATHMYFVKRITARNTDTSNTALIALQSITSNTEFMALSVPPNGVAHVEFDDPVPVTVGEGIEGLSVKSSAHGSVIVTVQGYRATPASNDSGG